MDREELKRLKKVADSRMAAHKKVRFWFRTQFHSARRYSQQILDGDLKGGWPKLDKVMQDMTSLGPHYISEMSADLTRFSMFPRTCAELERHLSVIEPTYQAMVNKWLDIKNSLKEDGQARNPPSG